MIDLNDMAIFAEVVDRAGFSAAGRALGMPKSNISRRVSRLENRLGVRLLERTTRRVHVTEIGDVYYRHCKRILEEAEHASISVSRLQESPRGLLRVGASITVGQNLIAPLVADFLGRYSEVQIDLVLSNRRIDMIEEGFDLLVRIGPLEDSSLIARRLGESRFHIYASPAYLAAWGTPAAPDALADHACLAMSDVPSPLRWRLAGPTATRTITVAPRASVNDFPSLRQIVLDGAGIAILPDYLGAPFEREGRLVRVLAEWSLRTVTYHALFPSHRGATPKVRAFLDFLGERLVGQLLDS